MPLSELRKLANKVKKVYSRLDALNTNFIRESNIQCPPGCGLCCHGTHISASPIEFLPLALHYYDQGLIDQKYWLFKEGAGGTCLLYNYDDHAVGRCGSYPYRALVCRLFGNSVSYDKTGNKRYLACPILKEEARNAVDFNTSLNRYAPVSPDFYLQLSTLHPQAGSELKPINLALIESLEMVSNHACRLHHVKRKNEGDTLYLLEKNENL